MSVEEMDTIPASSCENNVKQVLKSNEATHFRNCFHSDKILEGLQSLRKYGDDNFSFFQNKY